MKPTKEQLTQLALQLGFPYGRVTLMCDGYRIVLEVRLWKPMHYRVLTFVNGEFKGAWTNAEKVVPEQKFLRKQVTTLFKPADKKKAEKALGKRYVQQSKLYSGTFTQYCLDWASGRAALSHLCKVCESVEVVEDDTP